VNRRINRCEREKRLKNSYVMPIKDFINNAEITSEARESVLVTDKGNVNISLEHLRNCLLLFAIDGKPLKDNGPVQLFYQDGTNQEDPITGIKEIVIE